tara:strand:- start:42 stop:872 length:831 start_codon:yes stop_codon:yes gene_type:complete
MNSLEIHKPIRDKIDYFVSQDKVPNIVFHGSSGSGKSTLLHYLIQTIYRTQANIKKFVMHINCSHFKGIKFIRDDLKFFAKSNNTYKENQCSFKSIVLFNADKLTIDAQSALRRCIEIFSTSTRFFVVIESKEKLLKPILSRFCDFFVPSVVINKEIVNLYVANIEPDYHKKQMHRLLRFKKIIDSYTNNSTNTTAQQVFSVANVLYNKGCTGMDFIEYTKNTKWTNGLTVKRRNELLIFFEKSVKECRNEVLLLSLMLHMVFVDKNTFVLVSTFI